MIITLVINKNNVTYIIYIYIFIQIKIKTFDLKVFTLH